MKTEIKKDLYGFDVRIDRPNPVCMKEIGEPQCGQCEWTISDKTFYAGDLPKNQLDGIPWTQHKKDGLILPDSTFVSLKAYAKTQCKKANCDKTITNWRTKLDKLDAQK